MPRHPGRVERVDGVSWRESPALAGSLPYPHHLKEGRGRGKEEDGDEAAMMEDLRGAALLLIDRRRGAAMWWR